MSRPPPPPPPPGLSRPGALPPPPPPPPPPQKIMTTTTTTGGGYPPPPPSSSTSNSTSSHSYGSYPPVPPPPPGAHPMPPPPSSHYPPQQPPYGNSSNNNNSNSYGHQHDEPPRSAQYGDYGQQQRPYHPSSGGGGDPYNNNSGYPPSSSSRVPPMMPPQPPGTDYRGSGNNSAAGYPPPQQQQQHYHSNSGYRDDYNRQYNNNYNNNSYNNNYNRRPMLNLREPTNTVFLVGAVDIHSDEYLCRVFSEFGLVMEVDRKRSNAGSTVVFVHFRTETEATNAIMALTERNTLGPDVKFNYGRLNTYTREEMEMPYDPAQDNNIGVPYRKRLGMGIKREREEFGGGPGSPPGFNNFNDRSAVYGRRLEERQPTDVLYLGGDDLRSVSNDQIKKFFSSFKVTNISRNDRKNIIFVYFDSVEQASTALRTMAGAPLEGRPIKMNYGSGKSPDDYSSNINNFNPSNNNMDGAPQDRLLTKPYNAADEPATNVIFIKGLPPQTTSEDVDALMRPFPGFMSTALRLPCCLCNFESAAYAMVVRQTLVSPTVHGVPVALMFGRQNHDQPIPVRNSNNNISSSDNSAPGGVASGGAAGVATSLKLTRPPEPTLQDRLRTISGSPMGACGEEGKLMRPQFVEALVSAIDNTRDEESAHAIDTAMKPTLPVQAAHSAAIVAKRLHEQYEEDPIKKLHVLYAFIRSIYNMQNSVAHYSKEAVELFMVVFSVVSTNQSAEGREKIRLLLKNFEKQFFKTGGQFTAAIAQNNAFATRASTLMKELNGKLDEEEELDKLII